MAKEVTTNLVERMNKSRTKYVENVYYAKAHCEKCAEAAVKGLIGTELDCPERGTFHGVRSQIFQENKISAKLIKKGFISPHWIDSKYASIMSPFMGRWGLVKNLSNLITSAGKAGAASRLNGSGAAAAFTYIAVGTGATAANVSDTTLQTETAASGLTRANSTASLVTTSVTNDTAQLLNTFSVTGTVAVTESGVLNASSSGTLLCRQVFSAVNVVNGDSLQITWKIQCS